MKVKILSMEAFLGKSQALVEVTTGFWKWKRTERRWVWGINDGTVWRWHATRKHCPEWLELKLWVEWSKRINEGEKNARSIKH